MRKLFVCFLMILSLCSCEIGAKRELFVAVTMANFACPKSLDGRLFMDSILYKGREKQVRYCFSYAGATDEYREVLENDIANIDSFVIHHLYWLELISDAADHNDFVQLVSLAKFGIEVAFLYADGTPIRECRYNTGDCAFSEDEVKLHYLMEMDSSLQNLRKNLPLVLDDGRTLDSIVCDASSRQFTYHYTIHDEKIDVDKMDQLSDTLKAERIEHFDIADYCLCTSFDGKFKFNYTYQGSPLFSFSIDADDLLVEAE